MPKLRNKTILAVGAAAMLGLGLIGIRSLTAVEIPLDNLTPVRIGYVDLQKVFDEFPDKSFAEGDLLKEIEKRRRELSRRQSEINTLRQQIAVDEAALSQAKAGLLVVVPVNSIPEPVAAVPAPVVSTTSAAAVRNSTAPAVVEPYPTDDPLAGLPGHEFKSNPTETGQPGLPGMSEKPASMLDLLAAATGPVLLSPQAVLALETRISVNHRTLDRDIAQFRNFRMNAIDDMKVLQTEKTYGVMSKIYAVLETLARDEGVTVVLDKSYILYGEDSVDLSDQLMQRLQQAEGIQ